VRAIDGVHEAVAARHRAALHLLELDQRTHRDDAERTRILPLFKGSIFSALETPSKQAEAGARCLPARRNAYGADPANTFVIEDSVHGISGAVAAGMRVIGFTGGAHSYPGHADALTEAGAETVIRRWTDLGGVIRALSMWSEHA
jgi:beta-phosphoglucomutase-like phosphatase (HAD superfamily)